MRPKEFPKESLNNIKDSLDQEKIELDRPTVEKIIQTARLIVRSDKSKKHFYEHTNTLDDEDCTFDMDLYEDGVKSKIGTLNIKVSNTYFRDHDEDPLEDFDTQIIEISFNKERVFFAEARKATFVHLNLADYDPEPDAELKDFRVKIIKPGVWILPLLKIGAGK